MALLEHSIKAYNQEASLHELSGEAMAVLDDLSNVSLERLQKFSAEIQLVQEAIALMASLPSRAVLDLVQDLLESDNDG